MLDYMRVKRNAQDAYIYMMVVEDNSIATSIHWECKKVKFTHRIEYS